MQAVLQSNDTQPLKGLFNRHARLFFNVVCLLFLTACSHLTSEQTPEKTVAIDIKTTPTLVSHDYIRKQLNAEFILQREGPNKAFEAFYQLATESGNLLLIERLARIAITSQNPLYIEKSANLWLSADPYAEAAYALKLQIIIKGNRSKDVTDLINSAIQNNVPLRFLPLYLEENIRDNTQVTTIEKAILALTQPAQNNQYVQLSHAHILLLTGQYQLAIEISEQLLSHHDTEKSEALYLILSFGQKNLDRLEDAISTLKMACEAQPGNRRLLMPLIDFLVENHQSDNAIATYRAAQLNAPEKQQVGINLMRSLLERDQPDLALTVAYSLPNTEQGLSDQVQFLTAIALSQQGKKADAIRAMEQVNGALRSNASNQMALWLYEASQENTINDMILNRTLRENMPEQIAAISGLHEEKGRIDLSYDLFNRALIALPESDIIRYRKALLADTIGLWEVTESELKILLQKDTNNPQYLNALGYTLLTRTTRLDEAMTYIELAYEKVDDDPAIIDSLGWGFFLKGELEQSSYYLQKAWSLLPDAEIAAHYGESLWKQRHYKKAIEIWRTALERSPNTPLLLDTIQRLSPTMLDDAQQETPHAS
ncbi:hypothetical protein [Marinomonas sp. IMCC 4694]|uniref:hypothetical protein n=1 Tax=Marinomonas sp. IMCC 4694 TaxID=2605432 RepID=UPI0021CCD21A|nr:hypothetical protein [Marinomonas sp. IMCC 4694]